MRSAGSKVGRELQALEARLNAGSQRFHRECFRQAGNAFQENVPIGQQTKEQPVDQIFLPDNDVSDLLANQRNPVAELLDLLRDFLRGFHGCDETKTEVECSIELLPGKALRSVISTGSRCVGDT